MGTYRIEWPCCDSVTETEAWEPSACPFCVPDARIAELEATITRYEESTRLAEAHLTLTLTQLAEAQAECARLRGSIEAAARYGWEHDRWQWSAVKGGLDRFTDAALRGKESK